MTSTAFDRRMKKLKKRMEKLKVRYTVVARKGGMPKVLSHRLAKIKRRMAKVADRMKKLVVRARTTQAPKKAPTKKKLPVSRSRKFHGKTKTVKAPRVAKVKLVKIGSLAELSQRAKIDPAYKQLAITAASTLGKSTDNLGDAMLWLHTNANETSEEGVIKEVNGVRDIVEDLMTAREAKEASGAKASSFTEEELKEIERAANRTFEYIAGDFFSMIREADGRDYAKQAEVIEMVVDANRMSSHGGLSHELEERLYALDMAAQNKIMKKIFPAKRYS